MNHGETSGSATRGFLFADLRGYTAFVERAGAHRAAVMLARYRELVREQVGRFRGAEIRTEGDSFYVVFDRASVAIECGLAIVAAAADATRAEPEHPIAVGIGVHAGETVETAEGYVGTAVNIAARVCAVAPSNAVLITDTVRALTAGVVPAQFVPFGSRRLKGLAQPIALYRALPADSAVPRAQTRMRAGLPLAALAAAAVVVIGAIGVGLAVASGMIGSRPSASGLDASNRLSTPAGAAPSRLGSPSPTVGEFPTDAEEALRAIFEPRPGDACQRMALEDAPRHFYPDADGVTRPHDIAWVAGVDCDLGGVTAPNRAWMWRLPPVGGSDSRAPTPNEVLSLQGSRVGAAPGGTCADGAPALENWSFGQERGLLLCYQSDETGATVMWAYEDETLIGKAIRFDRDMATLLAWWADVARFGP